MSSMLTRWLIFLWQLSFQHNYQTLFCPCRRCCQTAISRTSPRTGTMASTCPRCWTTAGPAWCPTGRDWTQATGRTTWGGPWRSRRGSSGSPWCWSQSTSPRPTLTSCRGWPTSVTSWRRRTVPATTPPSTGSRIKSPISESTILGWVVNII